MEHFMKNKAFLFLKRVFVIACALLFFALLVFIMKSGYSQDWTGFGKYQTQIGIERSKTLWDWMDLLIVPIFLAGGAFLLNNFEKKRSLQIEEQRANSEREIAKDNLQETLLQNYLDKMGDLLIDKNLKKASKKVKDVARVKTLTVLRRLDKDRKVTVMLFLIESKLVLAPKPVISLSRADLMKADFRGTNLSSADLSETYLIDSLLTNANLSKAVLRGSALIRANLEGANLSGVDLTNAILKDANLNNCNLTGAQITSEQLKKVKSLDGAILPKNLIS